jgi:hypothetical protein
VAGVLATTLLVAPFGDPDRAEAASAVNTTVVRGTAFPDPLTGQLSFAGCATMDGVTPESPQATIGTGPGVAPSGTRSLGYDLAGGNALGALFMRPSMAETTTADLQVYAAAGSRGVAYAGYQDPADAGTSRVWIGRVDLMAGAAGWQRVDATGLSYSWTLRDLQTGTQLVPAVPALISVPAFMAGHGGDGAGFYSIGFGCDGSPFSLDTFRVGTSGSTQVYDLEGLATTTTIGGAHSVLTGESTRLTGTVRDQAGARIPGATLLLEQQTPAGWRTVYRDEARTDPVVVDAAGTDPVVEVTPERTTSYRFRFVDRPLAEGSASAPFAVTVTPLLTAQQGEGRVVTGTLTPAVPGAVVTLWRAGRAGTSVLARAEVDADGHYEIPVPAEVGGDLVVRWAGNADLQAATSGTVTVDALVAPAPTDTPTPAPTQTPTQDPTTAPAEPTPSKQAEQAEQGEPTREETPEQQPAETPASTPAQQEQQPAEEPAATTTETAAP